MKSFDVLSYPQLMFDSKYCRVIKNKKEMLDVTVSAINEIVGGEVVGLDALEKVTKDAVNKEYKSKIVPILIYSDDENFVDKTSNDLRKLNPRVVRISAGKTEKDINPLFSLEKVTEETVKNTLKDIANKS
jgi:predicted RNA-binding protein Jag